ncbi:hypothetical protein AB0E96_30415, partial [Kitasatospora sp. NPDC036755]
WHQQQRHQRAARLQPAERRPLDPSLRRYRVLVREPQVNAWYVLRDGRVLPLDDEARRSVGAGGVTLAAYQQLVHQRYGDKLPGSAYDRAGKGGGYEADGAAAASQTVAGPQSVSVAEASGGGSVLPAVTAAAALGATALVGAGAVLRRRAGIRRG